MLVRRWGIEKSSVYVGDQDTREIALKGRLENNAEEGHVKDWQRLCRRRKIKWRNPRA